jgi:hypothetical protein
MNSKEVPCSIPKCRNSASYKIAAPWSDGCREELTTYELACVEHCIVAFRDAERRRHVYPLAGNEKVGEIGIYRCEAPRTHAPLLRLRGLEAACRSWDQAARQNVPQMSRT